MTNAMTEIATYGKLTTYNLSHGHGNIWQHMANCTQTISVIVMGIDNGSRRQHHDNLSYHYHILITSHCYHYCVAIIIVLLHP